MYLLHKLLVGIILNERNFQNITMKKALQNNLLNLSKHLHLITVQ